MVVLTTYYQAHLVINTNFKNYVCAARIFKNVIFSKFFLRVIPRRQVYNCRRFGTFFRVHLHRLKCEAYEDGTDRRFRNVGNYKPDAGELP